MGKDYGSTKIMFEWAIATFCVIIVIMLGFMEDQRLFALLSLIGFVPLVLLWGFFSYKYVKQEGDDKDEADRLYSRTHSKGDISHLKNK